MMQNYFRIYLIGILAVRFGICPVVYGNPQFTISFHSESVVVGSEISLGEIGKIVLNNEKLCKRLSSLVIAEAAPPGETREISLSYIKKRLKELGFDIQQIHFKGPKVLRITTMPNKLIDLLIEDKIASRDHHACDLFDVSS
jgi:hypothetical protein